MLSYPFSGRLVVLLQFILLLQTTFLCFPCLHSIHEGHWWENSSPALVQFHPPTTPSKNRQEVLLIQALFGIEYFLLLNKQNTWARPSRYRLEQVGKLPRQAGSAPCFHPLSTFCIQCSIYAIHRQGHYE